MSLRSLVRITVPGRLVVAALASLPILLAGCGNRTVGTTPAPAGDGPTVRVWRENLEDNSNSVLLWAENTGSVPLVVTRLRLYSCVNLYQACGEHAPNVRLEPGQKGRIARLDPSDHRQRPGFGYEFAWSAPRRSAATPAAPTPREVLRFTTITRDGATTILQPVDLADWRPLVAPRDEGGACGSAPPSQGEGRMLAMDFRPPGMLPVRSVVVGVDAGGRVVMVSDNRYGWERALNAPPREGVVGRSGPRTTIAVDVLAGTALLINEPVDGPAEQRRAEGRDLLDAPALGPLRALAERVVRECR